MWTVRFAQSATAALLAIIGLSESASAQVVGRVLDRNGNGVPAASLTVVPDSGQGPTVLSDSVGGFRIPVVPSGQIRLEVRAFGYAGTSRTLDYQGRLVSVDVQLLPDPVRLDGIAVDIDVTRPRLERGGFYRRATAGAGKFLDFDADPPDPNSRLVHLLRHVPGVLVVGDEPVFSRYRTIPGCAAPVVVVNESPVRSQSFGRGFRFEEVIPPLALIAAVEFYSSPKFAPMRWRVQGSECGVIAIWTKR